MNVTRIWKTTRSDPSLRLLFTGDELKAMLCYLAINYDVKMPDGMKGKPGNEYIGNGVLPKRGAEIMIKRRDRGGL